MNYIPLLLCILMFSTGWLCENGGICSNHFRDLSAEPVGCDETTMRTFPSWSKLSCAISCIASNSCAVFKYSSDTNTCSLCPGELIENLTFGTDRLFSWPYQYRTLIEKNVNLSDGLNIGALVHMSGYMNGPLTKPIVLRLNPFYEADSYPFCLHLNYSYIVIHSTLNPKSKWKNVQLSPGAIEENSTHSVDVLVAKKGYQVFLDQTFIGFEPHLLPYNVSMFVRITGRIDIDELFF